MYLGVYMVQCMHGIHFEVREQLVALDTFLSFVCSRDWVQVISLGDRWLYFLSYHVDLRFYFIYNKKYLGFCNKICIWLVSNSSYNTLQRDEVRGVRLETRGLWFWQITEHLLSKMSHLKYFHNTLPCNAVRDKINTMLLKVLYQLQIADQCSHYH